LTICWDDSYAKTGFPTKPHSRLQAVVDLFKRNCVKNILDLGCGAGRNLVYLAKHDFSVYGLDISSQGLKIAEQQLKSRGLTAGLVRASIHSRLPYPDNFFDAVICIRVLNHGSIEQIRMTISEIERILKTSGLLFLTVRKEVPKKTRVRIRMIAPRTFVPVEGIQKGIVHYQFNKALLKKELCRFALLENIVIDEENSYVFLGQLRKETEQAAILVKPDAIKRKLVGRLRELLQSAGLNIVYESEIQLNEEQVMQFQPFIIEIDSDIRQAIINSLCQLPIIILLVEGNEAIEKTKEIKIKFRRQYGPPGSDIHSRAVNNLVHAPDNYEELYRLITALKINIP